MGSSVFADVLDAADHAELVAVLSRRLDERGQGPSGRIGRRGAAGVRGRRLAAGHGRRPDRRSDLVSVYELVRHDGAEAILLLAFGTHDEVY